jgi:Na+-transporting methylmalonyl-CoA/oxaloacetate decarboxylase beta subunit
MVLAPHLLGPVAVSAYTYMSMVPLIQPPVMRLLTTKKERAVVMKELREVSRTERINPLIGAAGVSAVPMAARVAQKVGQETDPTNYLLMHAMGPNVAGVIGTAVAAGVLIAVLG